jgi:hypothetical protein
MRKAAKMLNQKVISPQSFLYALKIDDNKITYKPLEVKPEETC